MDVAKCQDIGYGFYSAVASNVHRVQVSFEAKFILNLMRVGPGILHSMHRCEIQSRSNPPRIIRQRDCGMMVLLCRKTQGT